MYNNSHLADRKYIISGFFIVVAIVYICRLFYIQLIDDQYKLDARNNAFRNRTEYPLRGYIYDRNGKLLVQNVLSYDLLVTPKLVKDCDTMALCQVLEITKAEFLKKMKKASQAPNSPRKESIFEKQLSNKVYAAFKRSCIALKALMFNHEQLENIRVLLPHIY
jgi:penicillin-binding protein 2